MKRAERRDFDDPGALRRFAFRSVIRRRNLLPPRREANGPAHPVGQRGCGTTTPWCRLPTDRAGPAGDDDGPAEQCKDNRACRYAEPAEAARPLASLASHLFDIEIALQSAGDRCVDLLHGEADEAEPLPVPARVLLILWRLSELVLWK